MEIKTLMAKGEEGFIYVHKFVGTFFVYIRYYGNNSMYFLCAVNSECAVKSLFDEYGVERYPANNGVID